METEIICPKCQAESGDSWIQCEGDCPMPMSPHYRKEKPKNPSVSILSAQEAR